MRFFRVKAVILHALHHVLHSREAWVDIGWFPVVNMITIGGFSLYMAQMANDSSLQFATMAIVLWFVLEVGNYSLSVGALWEIWSRSFSSLFTSPLTVEEFVFGHICFGAVKQIVILLLTSSISLALFGLSPFQFGMMFPVYMMLLAVFGWAFGMFVFGLILRFGTGLQSLAWGLVYALQPLIGIYYPIQSLPPFVQIISKILAPSYVFTSARYQSESGEPMWDMLTIALVLDILTFLLSYVFLKHMWNRARKTGDLARMEG